MNNSNKIIIKVFTILAFLMVPFYIVYTIATHSLKEKKVETSSELFYKNRYHITTAKKAYLVQSPKNDIIIYVQQGIYPSVYSSVYSQTNVSVAVYGKTDFINKLTPSEVVQYKPIIEYAKDMILQTNIFEIGRYDIYIERIQPNTKYLNAAVVWHANINDDTTNLDNASFIVLTFLVDNNEKPNITLFSVIKDDHTVDFYNVFKRSVYKFIVIKQKMED